MTYPVVALVSFIRNNKLHRQNMGKKHMQIQLLWSKGTIIIKRKAS